IWKIWLRLWVWLWIPEICPEAGRRRSVMIDLHAHIVPGVDDGARNLSDSLEMARMAAKSGVTILAATSHGEFACKDPGEYLRLYRERLLLLRRKVREE